MVSLGRQGGWETLLPIIKKGRGKKEVDGPDVDPKIAVDVTKTGAKQNVKHRNRKSDSDSKDQLDPVDDGEADRKLSSKIDKNESGVRKERRPITGSRQRKRKIDNAADEGKISRESIEVKVSESNNTVPSNLRRSRRRSER